MKIGYKYHWMIGPLQFIGKNSGTILKSKDVTVQCPYDLENMDWFYVPNGWSHGNSFEINVHCLKGNFFLKSWMYQLIQ